ncbi:J domain-containing protein [Sphingosinithalassobacter portus]|uniref:J domain-containing protein n=1 Tax=Stakelama portus TaxID=2676234 RepID=UPI0011AB8E9E|nr:J domain-containing protein [Sphingosinithalassobacter portus]
MMTRSAAWRLLGIAPTDSKQEIRRAYAAALKAIDPDSDPEAFRQLRAAFETVSAGTPHDRDRMEPVPELSEPAGSPAPATDTAKGDFAYYDQVATALIDALSKADPEALPDAETALWMRRQWLTIQQDPRLEKIDIFDRAAQIFGHVVARAFPYSKPLVRPVVTFFRWQNHEDDYRQDMAATYLVERLNDLDFADAAREPGSAFHRAWTELSTPHDGSSRLGRVPRHEIAALLDTIDSWYPMLRSELDMTRVGSWELKLESSEEPWWKRVPLQAWWMGLILLSMVLGHFNKPDADPHKSPYRAEAPLDPRDTPRSPYADWDSDVVPEAPLLEPLANDDDPITVLAAPPPPLPRQYDPAIPQWLSGDRKSRDSTIEAMRRDRRGQAPEKEAP